MLLAVPCLLVWCRVAVFATEMTQRPVLPDSLPHDWSAQPPTNQPVVKNAVVNAINRKVSDTPGGGIDTLSFDQLGLSGLHNGARKEFMQYVNAGRTSAGVSRMQTVLSGMKDTTKRARYLDNKLRGFYALKQQQLPGGLSLPSAAENQLQGISLKTTYSDSTAMMSGWWNEGVLKDRLTVASIPLQLNYSTLSGYDYANTGLNDAHFMKVSFDREAYMEKVNGQLQQTYDLNKYFLEDLDIRSSLKAYASQRLTAINIPGDSSGKNITADQLMYLDSAQLSAALLKNNDSSYYTRVMTLKKEMGGVKEMNRMLGAQQQVKGNIESWVRQPENTSRMGSNLLQMSFLQRLLMNMKELKMGSIGADASKGTMSDLFMTGVAGSFLKNNKFLMLAAGKSNEMGVQDAGLQSATGAGSYSMQFLRMGRGDIGSKQQSHVSVLNANAKAQSNNGFNTAAISRNVFVGSVSQQCSLGELGTIDIELSKSSSQYGNSSHQDAASVSRSAASQFLDDIWATASVGLAYNGDIKKWGLSQKVYLNYAGLGYVNPGTPFAGRGTLQYGLMLKRNWLKNRAMVSLRTDIRNLATSPVTDNKRRSLQYALDARYRFTRKFSLSMNILQNTLRESAEGEKYTAFLNRKISFISQANGKLGGKSFSNSSTLGIQQLNYASLRSLFVNAGSMHTFMAGPGMVVINAMYNRDLKDAAVYNNLLNTEAGYQYMVWKSISCGSSLIYMDSKDVVTQIGLRQQVSAQMFKRWNLSISADCRQNLKNTTANYYYGRFNTAMSLNYQIN